MNHPIAPAVPLVQHYAETRDRFVQACKPLILDDYNLQAAPFTSPPKWHLAHTSWFFETFLLKPFLKNYQCVNPLYEVLFNSYYNGIGDQFPRPQRGLLTRPGIDEVLHYRRQVDEAMLELLGDPEHVDAPIIVERTRLGIEHEKQHQELFYTDLKYSLAVNPLYPPYAQSSPAQSPADVELDWLAFDAGLVEIGVKPQATEFAFDNESPCHQVYLQAFTLANRLVSNGEYQAFIEDGGYRRPEFWLADGWDQVQSARWQQPLYWRDRDGQAMEYTLYGLLPREEHKPVCHISAYEADAYARWAGARLPLEQEWEYAAATLSMEAPNNRSLHPQAAIKDSGLQQLYDSCWQWTGSAYRPYPGFSTASGAIGEYNGKFMSNQWVLRGGSCVSPANHLRPSYRNFFYPQDRWQFSGIRLARDIQ